MELMITEVKMHGCGYIVGVVLVDLCFWAFGKTYMIGLMESCFSFLTVGFSIACIDIGWASSVDFQRAWKRVLFCLLLLFPFVLTMVG